MSKTRQIRAVEMVRQIRDELARELAGKSDAEIIAFYNKAGRTALEAAGRRGSGGTPSNKRMEPARTGTRKRAAHS